MKNSEGLTMSKLNSSDFHSAEKSFEKTKYEFKEDSESGNEPLNIDGIQKWADRRRRYEKMLVWLWLIPVTLSVPCAYMNVMLIVYVPQYSCVIPPTPDNITRESWNEVIIPQTKDSAVPAASSCHMYNYLNNSVTDDFLFVSNKSLDESVKKKLHLQNYASTAVQWMNNAEFPRLLPNKTECLFGLEFDYNKMTGTTARKDSWIKCKSKEAKDKSLIAIPMIKKTVLTIAQCGNLVGAVVFGALADRFGRLKVLLFLSVKMAILGSINATLVDTRVIYAFRFIISMGLPAMYQVLLITALEQVGDDRRAMVGVMSSLAFSVGQSLIGVYATLFDWFTLCLLTSVPSLLVIIATICLVEESPRWLVSRNKIDEAVKVLQKIAKRNKFKLTKDEIKAKLLKAIEQESIKNKENSDGDQLEDKSKIFIVRQILKHRTLSLRICLIILNWAINIQVYMGPIMRYATVSPNPLTGWSLLSAVEIPACLLVFVLLKFAGRRTMHIFFMTLCTMALIGLSVLTMLEFTEDDYYVYGLVMTAKLGASITFLIIYLQSAELLPTPIRTSVTGVANLVAIACFIPTPLLMLTLDPVWKSYFILAGLGGFGIITAVLLPDTTGRKLPQTLYEAEHLK